MQYEVGELHLSSCGETAAYDKRHFGLRILLVLPQQNKYQLLFKGKIRTKSPKPCEVLGCEPPPVKGNLLVDFSGF